MEERIELAPNCSLTPTTARRFFVGTCLFSLAFAMVFVVHGFWPVLPFWALEMAALGLALHGSMGASVRGRQLSHRRGKVPACPAFAGLGGRDERIAAAWLIVKKRIRRE